MKKSSPPPTRTVNPKDKLLPRLSLFFFKRSRTTALIWLVITLFGVLSYTTLLKREGFPSINIPLVIVDGSYAVDDAQQVDAKVAEPLSKIALKQSGVSSVSTQSEASFFSATIQYSEDTNSDTARKALEQAVKNDPSIPKNAQLNFTAPYFGVTGGSLKKIDATVSVYAKDNGATLQELTARATKAADYLNKQKLSQVDNFFVQSPYEEVTNPFTGQKATVQRSFDRYGERNDSETKFAQSVIIGVASVKGADVIKLDDQIHEALAGLSKQVDFQNVDTAVSASYAPSIKDEISELQRVLLEGLLAVLVIGSIIIAIRASFITVISMVTVIAATIGVLFLFGYTLNVITLFALILGPSLVVDDTIIMVEALDASRRKHTNATDVVGEATRKISRAMVAATTTAALSFAPLLFVGGILGGFIRAIPVTIISALLISLFVALVFIPLFARFILLGKKQLGDGNVKEVAAGIEEKIAKFVGSPMRWARHSRPKEFAVGITALCIGLAFIVAGGLIASKVAFNIFPPTKDTNQIAVALSFPRGTTIQQAEAIAEQADSLTSKIVGDAFIDASYYGMASAQTGTLSINLTPYSQREVTAPQLVDKPDATFKKDFPQARADAYTLDIGPPSSGFNINIDAHDRDKALKLANDMVGYLKGRELLRPSGEKAKITEVSIQNADQYIRSKGEPVVTVNALFDGTDTTTLTTLAQTEVNDHYNTQKLKEFGLSKNAITFDLGQESENQDSFKTLALAFPALLFVIYLLLALQFRSLLQPLLIFMALPFSFFGISLGLYLTDNAFSFFAMLGFFALIGLSIKNTILLTDYANQARRAGMGPVDAAIAALGERFRPLIATSITAVVSLIPLAITSPFWQGLAVVLIFGLISSTFLVITVFPYYYLGAEYLRLHFSRKGFFGWLGLNVLLAVGVGFATKSGLSVALALVALNLLLIALKVNRRRSKQKTA